MVPPNSSTHSPGDDDASLASSVKTSSPVKATSPVKAADPNKTTSPSSPIILVEREPRPVPIDSARYWMAHGRYIYDADGNPVIPSNMRDEGPVMLEPYPQDRAAPAWDPMPSDPTQRTEFTIQEDEIARAFRALDVESQAKRRDEIVKNTFSKSKGYGQNTFAGVNKERAARGEMAHHYDPEGKRSATNNPTGNFPPSRPQPSQQVVAIASQSPQASQQYPMMYTQQQMLPPAALPLSPTMAPFTPFVSTVNHVQQAGSTMYPQQAVYGQQLRGASYPNTYQPVNQLSPQPTYAMPNAYSPDNVPVGPAIYGSPKQQMRRSYSQMTTPGGTPQMKPGQQPVAYLPTGLLETPVLTYAVPAKQDMGMYDLGMQQQNQHQYQQHQQQYHQRQYYQQPGPH
ncbi:uncharacterized protein K452DRAFT_295646 [Aplosporella prunicola CBS 121167]|uniref:Uncharacterized protein n=1 Tax=Aplosporella prunicola CBS 121167 TaxID=1176127 RepID=A0A6A6BM23_9PEZI|nr:uncharacterized protein K452DRAFT_295646 [Aplosporella prunicola CBS 121167]KAF2145096.1 hypothetical protein K452DRAFT_295646 [Aplosporella prunicola CBS 121167]